VEKKIETGSNNNNKKLKWKKKYKTRFPMARIKKIMQSDEEVGKIALATPILISKALELFMRDLIQKNKWYNKE